MNVPIFELVPASILLKLMRNTKLREMGSELSILLKKEVLRTTVESDGWGGRGIELFCQLKQAVLAACRR
jgi:hypothetical protein